MTTITELIKTLNKWKKWKGNPAIASVRIEFGDGSIYADPPTPAPEPGGNIALPTYNEELRERET